MRDFCRRHLLYSPHGLSDYRSEAFRQKMIRYFQYNSGDSGSEMWNGIKIIPGGNENTEHLLKKALEL